MLASGPRITLPNGDRHLAAASDQHRMHGDVFIGRQLGRRHGVELARVVGAVGDQHHNLRVGGRGPQAIDGRADPQTDGGAVGERPQPDLLEKMVGDIVVQGERTDRDRRTGKDDQPDPVVGPAVEKPPDDLFRDPEAVGGLEVEGRHRTRDVEGDHHIHPLRMLEMPGEHFLRTRQGDGQGRKGESCQHPGRRRPAEAPTPAFARPPVKRKGKTLPTPTQDPHRDGEETHPGQGEPCRLSQPHHPAASSISLSSSAVRNSSSPPAVRRAVSIAPSSSDSAMGRRPKRIPSATPITT